MNRTWLFLFALLLLGVVLSTYQARAEVIFSDDFTSGPSPLWGNEFGAWHATGGVYNAGQPSGNPPFRYTSLPFILTDFSIQAFIIDIGDGGFWLRSQDNRNGVLLVTGGDGYWDNGSSPQKGKDLYWAVYVNGVGEPPGLLSRVANVFEPGITDATVRVDVIGNTYRAYVDDVLTSTLVNDTYTSGRVALMDAVNPQQAFDNVLVSVIHVPHIWNIDSNGNWSAAGNWTGGIPNAPSARAVFGPVITAPRVVTTT